MKEFLKAFEMMLQAEYDGKIEKFTYTSDDGYFLINVSIGHEDYPYADEDAREIELHFEEVLEGQLDIKIAELKEEFRKMCQEAEEDDGYDESYVPHDTSLLGMHYAF